MKIKIFSDDSMDMLQANMNLFFADSAVHRIVMCRVSYHPKGFRWIGYIVYKPNKDTV